MNWTTIYVSSVTNALRGKTLLEKQGYTAHMQRTSRALETDGCGYSILVRGDAVGAENVLTRAGLRVLRVERGGASR